MGWARRSDVVECASLAHIREVLGELPLREGTPDWAVVALRYVVEMRGYWSFDGADAHDCALDVGAQALALYERLIAGEVPESNTEAPPGPPAIQTWGGHTWRTR